MRPDVLMQALKSAGATMDGNCDEMHGDFTIADLYSLGLSGTQGSAANRKKLLKALELPERLSANALLDVLNVLVDREELFRLWNEISE